MSHLLVPLPHARGDAVDPRMSVFLLALAGTLVLAASQCGNPGFCVPEEAYTLLCPAGKYHLRGKVTALACLAHPPDGAASTDGVVSPANDGICYNPGATAFLLARPLRRPPPNATVYLYLFSNSIRKISAVDASFEFDAALDVAWRDDRFNVSAIAAVALTCMRSPRQVVVTALPLTPRPGRPRVQFLVTTLGRMPGPLRPVASPRLSSLATP